MKKKIKPYPETHLQGIILIEETDAFPKKIPASFVEGDLGIQIAEDGRVWICINGIAFIRFRQSVKND